ncbi:DUF5097 domain-containing protein [Balamuthia mandrillaris]
MVCPIDHPHPASVRIPTNPAAVKSDPSDDSNSDLTNASSDNSGRVYEDTTSDDDKEEGTNDDHCYPDKVEAADVDKDEEEEKEKEKEKEEKEEKEKEEEEEEEEKRLMMAKLRWMIVKRRIWNGAKC